MPKSAKKRKDKAADFSKAKLKLGKGKQLPSNAIDTSFKARSIALPTQSIAHEKDAETATTKRRLTFDDLVTHAKHYNATVRKDAILGLKELLEAHEELLEHSLTALINACVRLIGDEDAGVRKALLAFLAWLLPRIPHENILPHSHLLLLFTTSAQTHIFPEIRIDAIRFLNICLEHLPGPVTSGWNEDNNGHGARVLEGYLGILGAGTKFGGIDGPPQATSTASVIITPTSKLIILQSLSMFLRFCISSIDSVSPNSPEPQVPPSDWYLASLFPSPHAYRSFEDLLRPSSRGVALSRTWEEVAEPDDDDAPPSVPANSSLLGDLHWPLYELAEVTGLMGSLDDDPHELAGIRLVEGLARSLHPVLVATFLDCAPAIFSPSANPSETEVELALTVTRIGRSLYSFISQNNVKAKRDVSLEGLAEMLSHMAPYFPFEFSGSRNIKLEQAFQDMNLIFCELVSLQILTTTHGVHPRHSLPGRRHRTGRASRSLLTSKGAWSVQAFRVGEYILQLLRGEAATSTRIKKPLTQAGYEALLPSIWAILNSSALELRDISVAVLHATIDHSLRTSCKSGVKASTLEFISRLVLVQSEPLYQGHFRFSGDKGDDRKLEEWFGHLPQALWEFGTNNLPASESILRLLLRSLQRNTRLFLGSKTTKLLRVKLVPYFSIQHAIRGLLPGPFSKLPISSPVRRLALDVVVSLLSLEGEDKDRLQNAVDFAVSNTDEESYWTQLQKHSSL